MTSSLLTMIKKSPASSGRFWRDEHGAITADYVVLTAAMVVLGSLAVGLVNGGTTGLSTAIDRELGSPRGVSSGTESSGQTGGSGGAWPGYYDPAGGYNGMPPVDGSGYDDPTEGDDSGDGNTPDHHGSDAADSGNEVTETDPVENDPVETGEADESDPGEGNSPGNGSNQNIEVDFAFEDLNLGCHWGERAVSRWLNFDLNRPTPFVVSGPGNPTAQNHGGQQSHRGAVQWGTNIQVDIPPPGQTYVVFMELGDRIGSFSVSRDNCG
ncbi:hypothetical protein [Roseinatronobacter sp.]|uniref:Flp family type IVb pilin n=1 Tax=Roseinatronobacter sp. TaxID=1945755 RepID=UPI0025D4126D|nr:hypothetical protein [Rhodobaca sp.]